MVAISLYRGNLHKVPDVPRRWLMPTRKISLKDFKSLLHRRNRALSRLLTTTPTPTPNTNFDDFGKNDDKDGSFVEIREKGRQKNVRKDGDSKKIGEYLNKDWNSEEIGNKDAIFMGIGEDGCGKNGSKHETLKEVGKNRDKDGKFEKNGCVKSGSRDGNLGEIGRDSCEKIGKKDGDCKQIGKNGLDKNWIKDGKLEDIRNDSFDKNRNKDGNLEGMGKIGCGNNGNEVGDRGEIGKNGCENKALEVRELVEEKGNAKDGSVLKKLVEVTESMVVEVKDGAERIKGSDSYGGDVARTDREGEMKVKNGVVANPTLEIAKKEEDASDKQKRRQEIEETLKKLNEKKHSLVQTLKQILNAEEELKRRSNNQGVAGQPPVSGGQEEGAHDSGSMSRHNTPRMGTEGCVSGAAEGAQTDDPNLNVHGRLLGRMNSTSPSSDTQQKKSAFIAATLPSQTNSGAANSPSRFALAAQQGLPPNLPSVSVSGTNYAASSPSPAANGGTSAFRDRRVPSPWS